MSTNVNDVIAFIERYKCSAIGGNDLVSECAAGGVIEIINSVRKDFPDADDLAVLSLSMIEVSHLALDLFRDLSRVAPEVLSGYPRLGEGVVH